MNLQQYLAATTVTSINSTTASLSDITFPGIYMCNVNQVSKSFLKRININDDDEAKLLFEQFLEKGPSNLDEDTKEANNKTLEDIMDRMTKAYGWTRYQRFYNISSQNCTDMILYVQWKSNSSYTKNFYQAFKSSSDYGACCLITPYLDFEYAETRDKNPNKWPDDAYHKIPKVFCLTMFFKNMINRITVTFVNSIIKYMFNHRER